MAYRAVSERSLMLILIKGAGDLASGIALRLHHAGLSIVMTDLPKPTSIRRTVCFSEAIVHGTAQVEDVGARRAEGAEDALEILRCGEIPIFADPEASCRLVLHPDAVVDAILAKKNLGTRLTDARAVVGVGPGFTAGVDCHAVVETQRGHTLGRVYTRGSAAPNTGVPGNIGGYTVERIIRAPKDGLFCPVREIGDLVEAGETVAYVDDAAVTCRISGVLRGILPRETPVFSGMKSGDVDPRAKREHCFTVSDKALAVGGGVLEAVLMLLHRKG